MKVNTFNVIFMLDIIIKMNTLKKREFLKMTLSSNDINTTIQSILYQININITDVGPTRRQR